MKILITGSHFTPAQAVIEKLLSIPDLEIVYLGRRFARDDDNAISVESKILPKLGVKFIPITAGKLNRFFSINTIISFLKTPVGFIQSFYYLVKEKPDLIVSFGGFTGMPVVVCGWLLSIPSLIHEQSLKIGLSNWISSFFADRIATSFKETKLPGLLNSKKITVTGNPIRADLLNPDKEPSKEVKNFIQSVRRRKKDIVLITAGNQGSHLINLIVEDKLLELTKLTSMIHQTGDSKYDDYSNLEKHQSENYIVHKWVTAEDLSFILDNADLVISRGGMNTLLELAIKSVPALMIPIPVGREQKENVLYFKRLGLGEILEEKQITPEIFMEKVKDMLDRKTGLKKLAGNAKNVVVLDAEKRLVQEILLMLNIKTNYHLLFK
jgi:UDP-N-acetylglucosamine--N-acetylmuramyl-(pentapeptide) pyrophosphoryl-undecaprenol N-acetylglucosamine transferase